MSNSQPIPNINIGQVYDQRYADSDVHYDELGRLADFFGRNMPVHRHDRFFQVHYVKSGSVRVYLDDQRYVQEGPMFFLTPPTIPHAFVTDAESDGHVLTVRQQLVWPLLEETVGLTGGAQIAPICVAVGDLGEAYHGEVVRLNLLFDQLRDEFADTRPGRASSMEALTRLIFISLLRLSTRSLSAQPARREDLQIFQRFNMQIERHYLEHLPLHEYARLLGVTEARLNDICRRMANRPSKEVVHERLLQEACRLLRYSAVPVTEISYQLGFADPAYFSRFFTKRAGMPPSQFRAAEHG